MKKAALRLTCLAAGCASLFAVAAPNLTPLTQATATINDCAAIVNSIAAIPVPPKHAEATQTAASNDAAKDPKQKVAIDPAHAAFAQQMKDGAAKFDACGKNVRLAEGQATAFAGSLAGQNLSADDAAAVKTAYETYTKAVANMQAALAALTSDHIRAAYMRGALQSNFSQAAPSGGPRRAQQ